MVITSPTERVKTDARENVSPRPFDCPCRCENKCLFDIRFIAFCPSTVVTPDAERLYIALSDIDRVAVVDILQGRVESLIDGVGDAPWGATLVGARNYCH
jgi:hypothetical protein